MSVLSKSEAESLVQALTGGQTPEHGQALIWEDDVGWTFGGAPSYAGVYTDKNTDVTVIRVAEVFHKFLFFDTNMVESRANGDHTTNDITVGDTGDHAILAFIEGKAEGVNKLYEVNAFEIDAAKKIITGITDADPAVVTSANHGLFDGDRVKIAGVAGMVEVNDQIFVVVRIDKDTFSLDAEDDTDIDATGYTAYSSGGTLQLATILPTHTDHKWSGGAADYESVSAGAMASLTKDNTIELCFENETDAVDMLIEGVTFFMFKLN